MNANLLMVVRVYSPDGRRISGKPSTNDHSYESHESPYIRAKKNIKEAK